jgi:arylsulfatase A-like enzyme
MLLLFATACTPGTVGGDGSHTPPPSTGQDTGGPTAPPPGPGIVSFGGAPPTNVLLISIDTLRRDRVGRYDGGTNTPFLDALLDQSVVLDDHRSCSDWTAPSMVCMLTGLFPPIHDFWPNVTGLDGVVSLPPDVQSIARSLGAEGYATRLVSANPTLTGLGRLSSGYDEVVLEAWSGANAVLESGLAEMDELLGTGGPWMLHLHFLDPHVPYCPPEEYQPAAGTVPEFEYDICTEMGKAIADWPSQTPEWRADMQANVDPLYNGEIRFVDDTLATLWGELETRGALDDTLVLFISDHGEQFHEHNGYGHALELHGEENKGIAAFWAPDLAPSVWTGPTTHVDIFATFAQLYGFVPEIPTDGIPVGLARSDRVRLSTQIRPPVTDESVDLWSPAKFAAVDATHVLHTDWDGRFELYDLEADPGELVDTYTADDPAVARLWAALEPVVTQVQEQWPDLGTSLPPGDTAP